MAPREALGLGVLVTCGDVVACGVLVVVGVGLVDIVADAEAEGVTATEEPLPDGEGLGGGGLTCTQAAKVIRKMAMRTQVEVRIRRICRTSRTCRLCRISRPRPDLSIRPVRLVPPGLSVRRFPARSPG